MVQQDEWEIYVVNEVRAWIERLPSSARRAVERALDVLADRGPALGREAVDTVDDSKIANLKELRVRTCGMQIRVLFVFDPWRSAILLVAGDKSAVGNRWYPPAIRLAEQRYEIYLKERESEAAEQETGGEGGGR